jgi:hypothetical protein
MNSLEIVISSRFSMDIKNSDSLCCLNVDVLIICSSLLLSPLFFDKIIGTFY